MAPPRLVADRFLLVDGRAIDLASGDPVLLRVERRVSGLAEWSELCARLSRIRHPWLAACIDYGTIGDAHTFEAYRLTAAVGRHGSGRDVVAGIVAFLAARGLACGAQLVATDGGRVIVPAAVSASATRGAGRAPRYPDELQLVAEHLRSDARPGLSHCDVKCRPRTDRRMLLRLAAREARVSGWVPVALDLLSGHLAEPVVDVLADRHVLILYDAKGGDLLDRPTHASALARLAAPSNRPHLLLRLVEERALRQPARSTTRSAVRAAREACEFPEGADGGWSLAREATAAFPAGDPAPRPRIVSRGGGALAIDAARSLLARGRHAAAERTLRQAASAAARRVAAHDAATCWTTLARLLVGRGRAAAAFEALDEADTWIPRGGSIGTSIESALLRGHAALLLLQAERAEAALRAAATTARLAGDEALEHLAAVRSAEGLWWLGRHAEARALVQRVAERLARLPCAVAVHALAVLARLEVADGLPDAGAAHVTSALDLAAGAPARVRRIAVLARARWLATAGECAGLSDLIGPLLAELHRERASLAVVDLRLLAAEGALRARDHPRARALARGFAHLAHGPTPPLVAARARLVLGALGRRADAERVRDSLVMRGFGAFASPDAAGLALPPPVPARSSPMLDAVLEMLRACQDEEPRTALARVAELLRVRCSAAVVAILTGGAAPTTIAVPSTGRPPIVSARRALSGGIVVDLHAAEAGQEAAVPMRHAGSLVGAVGCRWLEAPPGSAADVRRLLETAAAAAGPCARALEEQATPPGHPGDAVDLVGTSSAIDTVRRAIARAANAPFSVLVEGESGSGKELAARAIHRGSARRHRPFCVVNGAALPDDLLEAELFGHARGAFTGAIAERRGVFEEADGGGLFLDEVGELSPRAQAKLLRAVQEGEVRRLGETHARHVDARVIAATNRVLETEVAEGRFRRDLFYRLAVIRIRMPPLRERQDDVPELAAAMWLRAATRVGSRAVLSASTLAALARYDWPGNVRELQNVLAALAVSGPRRGVIGPGLLPAAIAGAADTAPPLRLEEARRHFEARFVRAALARAAGHRGRAAADLGVTRQGLAKLLERLGIEAEGPGG
jgi:DNA-binding NtrC family response regulator